jgi:hypothetical protein
MQRTSSDLHMVLDCGFSFCELLWALLTWFCGLCSQCVFDTSGFYNPSLPSLAGSRNCLAVGLCICSYQFLDDVPRTTVGLDISGYSCSPAPGIGLTLLGVGKLLGALGFPLLCAKRGISWVLPNNKLFYPSHISWKVPKYTCPLLS